MQIDNYYRLPDRMSSKELVTLFENIINEYNDNKVSKTTFLEIINILTDRQVMSYELLEDSIRVRLDDVITNMWNLEDYNEVDIILSLVVNLGLQKCYDKIRKSIVECKKVDKDILQEIKEMIEECGDDVSNPYKNLEKCE